jgi:hypothetical protein
MVAWSQRFYRVVKTNPSTRSDWVSNAERGMVPPDDRPETLRVWSGVSVYATAAQARRMARRYRGHGTFIATVEIKEGSPIRVERTLARPGHHTLWASPEELLAAVVAVEPL